MKKKWLLAACSVAMTACCALALIACAPDDGEGKHNFSSRWASDEKFHWHDCLDGDGATSDWNPHFDSDGDSFCDDCGFPMGGKYNPTVDSVKIYGSDGILVSLRNEESGDIHLEVEGDIEDFGSLNFEWDVEDETVATVVPYEGNSLWFRAIGHKEGFTDATVTVGGKSATVTLYVVDCNPFEVGELDIHVPQFIRIEKGETVKIPATGEYSWLPLTIRLSHGEESDSFRLNDDGSITALDEGECEFSYEIFGMGVSLGDKPTVYCNRGSEGLHYRAVLDSPDYDGQYSELMGIDASCEKDVVIADTYRGLPVTRLASYSQSTYDRYISFSEAGITSVKMSENLQYISVYEFKDCTQLTAVDFNGATFDAEDSGLESEAFAGCALLENIDLPDGIKSMDNSTFTGCTSLSEIDLPDSLQYLTSSIFEGCTNLSRVGLNDGLEIIHDRAFDGCTSLTHITIPSSVTEIRYGAFANSGLVEFVFPETVETVGDAILEGSQVASITFPTDFGMFNVPLSYRAGEYYKYLFGSTRDTNSRSVAPCPNLKTVIFQEGTTTIPYYVLNAVSHMVEDSEERTAYDTVTKVSIPDSFLGFTGEEVYGSNDKDTNDNGQYHYMWNLMRIAAKAGSGCYLGNDDNPYVFLLGIDRDFVPDAESVTAIHENTKVIGWQSVWAKGDVTVPDGVVAVEEDAFVVDEDESSSYQHTVTSISLPASLKSLAIPFTQGTKVATVEVRGDNGEYVSEGNVIYHRNEVCYVAPAISGALAFAEGTTSIGEGAMSGTFNAVTSLSIPKSLTTLPEFEGKFAALQSITVADENAEYASKTGVLYDADLANILYIPSDLAGDVVISDKITEIGTQFAGHSRITSLVIPDGVTVFEKSAIAGLTGLEKLTLPWLGAGENVTTYAQTVEEEVNFYFGYIFGQNYLNHERYPDPAFNGVPETLKEVVVTKQINVFARTFYVESQNIETIRFISTEHWNDKTTDGRPLLSGVIDSNAFSGGLKNLYLARGIGKLGYLGTKLEVLVLPNMSAVKDATGDIGGIAKTVYYAEATTSGTYGQSYNAVADRLVVRAKEQSTREITIYTGTQWHWEDGQGKTIGDGSDDASVWALGVPVPNDASVCYYKQ